MNLTEINDSGVALTKPLKILKELEVSTPYNILQAKLTKTIKPAAS